MHTGDEQMDARQNLNVLLDRLGRSSFRRRFCLDADQRAYLAHKTLAVVLQHARRFVETRLAPAKPPRDGRQTPMRGHPVFVAQHATATCCRKCLARWHGIPAGVPLSDEQVQYTVDVIARWLGDRLAEPNDRDTGTARQKPLPFEE